jgi:hypothetical protein
MVWNNIPVIRGCSVSTLKGENLAFIQTIFGENKRTISALAQLLQTPYGSDRALLRLDPLWDLLRADPGFRRGKAAELIPLK